MVDIFSGITNFFKNIFSGRGELKLGLYGPPNGGKTTLANNISKEWTGESVGKASAVAHETREVTVKEQIEVTSGSKKLTFNLVDTPGIATMIDYESFVKSGMPEKKAKKRAKEATKGVVEAIQWLDDMDAVVVVLDATKNPYTQVNVTILGNLDARNIPVLIAANKTDLKRSKVKKIQDAYPQYPVVGISAKSGKNMGGFYKALFELVR